jgi:hypothetical protein
MVNRAVVGVFVGVLMIALLVGVGIGTLLGGGTNGGGGGTPTLTDVNPTPFGTPTTTTTAATARTESATATATPRPTPTERPTPTAVPLAAFNESEIEAGILAFVNEYRRDRGLVPLEHPDAYTTIKRLDRLTANHSTQMARYGLVKHDINQSVEERFHDYEVYGSCTWESAGGGHVVKPDNPRATQLSVVGKTVAGRTDEKGRFNANETAVARAIAGDWFTDPYPNVADEKLSLEKARLFSVSVEVTAEGDVYAAGAICR